MGLRSTLPNHSRVEQRRPGRKSAAMAAGCRCPQEGSEDEEAATARSRRCRPGEWENGSLGARRCCEVPTRRKGARRVSAEEPGLRVVRNGMPTMDMTNMVRFAIMCVCVP
jgi:hypothetical protein